MVQLSLGPWSPVPRPRYSGLMSPSKEVSFETITKSMGGGGGGGGGEHEGVMKKSDLVISNDFSNLYMYMKSLLGV